MNPRRKKRLTITLSVLFSIGAIISLVLYALSQNIDLFYTPAEIVNGKDDTGQRPTIGQRIRVGGLVVPGSVNRDPNNLKVSFELTNKGEKVTVKYDGILPDLFREGQGIIANGVLVTETLLEASEVLAKHDENYMPKEVAESLGEEHQAPQYSSEQVKKN